MSSYTKKDLENSRKFSTFYNHRIRILNRLFKKYPFLISHLKYTIRDADTNKDYYVPSSLSDKCKVIDIVITEKLCDKLSCNKYNNASFCTPETNAHYVHIGDDQYGVVCQPACFRIGIPPTYSKDHERLTNMPQLNYYRGKCMFVPDQISNYLEKPFFRSDVVYETRVNDMPTGFSRESKNNEFGCGFTYRNNPTYCQYYDRTLNESGDCSYTWFEKGLDAIVGMSLVNTVTSTIRKISGKDRPFNLPSNIIKLPEKLEKKYTYEFWSKDIDNEFKIPPLMVFEDETQEERIVYAKNLYSENTNRDKREALSSSYKKSESEISDIYNKIKSFLENLLKNLDKAVFTKEMLEMIGFTISFELVNSGMKRLINSLIQKITLLASKEALLILSKAFPINCVRSALSNVVRIAVVHGVVSTSSKIAVGLLRLTMTAINVAEWILFAAVFLDIIFAIWDPYGYNKMFPKELPKDLMESAERSLRSELGVPNGEFTFDILCTKLLTNDELLEISMELKMKF